MSKNVFDVMAPFYLQEDRHWGSDLDFIRSAFEIAIHESPRPMSSAPLHYLDLGCGPGFHVCAMKELYPHAFILGIDPSVEMIEETKSRLRWTRLPPVALLQTYIAHLPAEENDVVSCLNNTLGNLQAEGELLDTDRVGAVRRIRGLVRAGGLLVTSVYNKAELPHTYGRRLRVLPKSEIERGDLFVEYKPPTNGDAVEYYSHWFSENELVGLLEQNSFRIELLEKRLARFVVRARAV